MKSIVSLFIGLFLFATATAHDVNYSGSIPHTFRNAQGGVIANGYFLFEKNQLIHLETTASKTLTFPLSAFSAGDRLFLKEKINRLNLINSGTTENKPTPRKFPLALVLLTLTLALAVLWKNTHFSKRKFLAPLFLASFAGIFSAFGSKILHLSQSNTSPQFLDSTFAAFVPQVSTFYDTTYYYVQSNGIPSTHTMMVGISNHGWQQQVPTPQCYFGTNAWPIPLHPTMAANPIPVDSIHFIRGAIALAANGIPIFNVHTNTGVDSYIDGQLDNFGGHCGRADDYHYHIAPLHLYNYTPTSLPCAIGLDGYAVYGSTEPNGSPMQPLDINHGHYGSNGVYHYHGTAAAPYMIARMAGQVTEDNTHQLIPQAAAHSTRPALTPLNGALITACTPNSAGNGYNLTYTLNGQVDSIVYTWNNAGNYIFRFYTAGNGTFTSNTYHNNYQCVNPLSQEEISLDQNEVWVYPNPAQGMLHFSPSMAGVNSTISLYSMQGKLLMQKYTAGETSLSVSEFPAGIYLCKIEAKGKQMVQKMILK